MKAHKPLAPEGTVSSFVENGIADVCFGHPKSNSLPASVLRGLADEIAAVGMRDDVRVVLLRSYGTSAFCAGASFDELVAIADPQAGKEFFMGFARVILAMTRCPKPIVTRVHGKVVGGGVGVVAASDYVIATEKSPHSTNPEVIVRSHSRVMVRERGRPWGITCPGWSAEAGGGVIQGTSPRQRSSKDLPMPFGGGRVSSQFTCRRQPAGRGPSRPWHRGTGSPSSWR